MKTYIGIDNGVTGTIGILSEDCDALFQKTPVFKTQDYTKAKKNIARVLSFNLYELLKGFDPATTKAVIERPMINPTRFQATISASRCLEAELVVLEVLKIPYEFCDSRDWQKDMLPKGCKGEELKKASLDIGNRLFPQFKDVKHPDRDGILIAEWARRKGL